MSRSQEQKELETPAMMVKGCMLGMLRLVFAGGEKSGVSMPRMFSAVGLWIGVT